jgi:hypothetical protein
MKRILFILSLMVLIASVTIAQDHFGKQISKEGAINTDELVNQMDGKKELNTKVEGKVLEVCQMKGCWMMLELPEGESMRVKFKDYAFFVPKDIAGKSVVIQGTASTVTTSVDELRHYAEDAGASEEEIAEITEPKTELAFEAEGVIIY